MAWPYFQCACCSSRARSFVGSREARRPANRFTQPYGFQRPSLDYAAPDLVAIQRRQDLLAIAFFVALIATLVLVIVLFPHGLGGTPS